MSEAESEARREWFRTEVLPLEPELRAFAERLARPGQTDAADLVNDVMVRMIALESWREVECPAAYARRVLSNLAAETARRSKVVAFGAVTYEASLALIDDAPDAETIVIARDELRRLEEAVASLPEIMRQVFTLKKVYGRTTAQIADELGLSIS